LNNSVAEDEVVIKKQVNIHRMNVKSEFIKIFKDPYILSAELEIHLIAPNENLEEGSGVGVVREAFCLFFEDFFTSNSIGREEKVPTIRHDMGKEEWEAIGKMLVYLIKRKVDYFPLSLSSVFLVSLLFGESEIADIDLISSFKNNVSLDEKDLINNPNFDEIKDDFIEMLSEYNCKSLPTKDNINELLVEIAHAELIQTPRYVSNCFGQILTRFPVSPFNSKYNLLEFHKERSPTVKKVISCLNAKQSTAEEVAVHGFFVKYLKSLNKKDLCLILRFITGGDMLPDQIEIEFVPNQTPCMPRAQTCSSVLVLSTDYGCFNELKEQFTNILSHPTSFRFTNI